jgi:hypothetical protein
VEAPARATRQAGEDARGRAATRLIDDDGTR